MTTNLCPNKVKIPYTNDEPKSFVSCNQNEEENTLSQNDKISDISDDEYDITENGTQFHCFNDLPANGRATQTGQSRTFTNFELQEMQNANVILMKKVIAHTNRPRQYKTSNAPMKISSATVNRQRKQKKIDYENLVSKLTIHITAKYL